jgi:hypothetical protein
MGTSSNGDLTGDVPLVQRISAVLWPSVLWPSFLLAGVATSVFFTFLDPVTLFECEGEPPLSRTAAYSLGFFLFWLLCAASSASSAYFLRADILQAPPSGESA